MSNVVAFRKPENEDGDGWLGGEGICLDCRHTWEAAAPVGTWRLDCPSCGSGKGVWRYPTGPQEGDEVLQCNCGSEALVAYRRGGHNWLRCMSCGTDQTEAYFG